MQSQSNLLFNKRFLLASLGIILAIVILIISLTSHSQIPSTITPDASGATSYTNAITGQSTQDYPGLNSVSSSSSVPIPTVTLDGFDKVFNYFSNDQGSNLREAISSFLFARSGLNNVTAGIKDGNISQLDPQTIQFTIVVVKPQMTYQVTAHFANPSQTIPNVTYKRLGQ